MRESLRISCSAGGKLTPRVQRITMSVRWMFMILLGCRLSHATESQNTCTCNEEMRSICGSGEEAVFVPCPNVTDSDVRFDLFKDDEVIYTCISKNMSWNCMGSHNRTRMRLHENKVLTGFDLTGQNNSSHGIYRCQGTVIFPPPYRLIQSEVKILPIEGHQCKCKQSSGRPDNPKNGFDWIWILVVVLLSIYSLTVTIVAFVIWTKLRKNDSQNDYMNTKPRAPRDRRKKKGIQNPRHF